MEWISRAQRCTMLFNPVGSIRSPYVQTNCNVPFCMKRNGLRSSWIHAWLGAQHPESSGLCGLNECAVSICPSIIFTKACLLSSTSTEGIREKLHQAFFFFLTHPLHAIFTLVWLSICSSSTAAAFEWPASFHEEPVNKGTQLCSHENSVPFPATSNVPAGLPGEGSCARDGHKFVQYLMDKKKKKNPSGKSFVHFFFLSTFKDFLYAKDALVESEETVPHSSQMGACPS